MKIKLGISPWIALAVSATALVACGSDNPFAQPDAPATGFVSIAVTDAPVDSAVKVCVEFNTVEFKHSDGTVANPEFGFDPAVQIDLLAQQGTDSAPLLLAGEMPAGQYNWVRLGVNAQRGATTMSDDGDANTPCVAGGSYIKLDNGMVHNLYVPSGDMARLKINRGFVLPVGGNASFTIDFDLRKSIKAPPGQAPDYMLRPTLRMVDNGAVGALRGSVNPLLVNDSNCTGEPAVYVFAGDVPPDDYDGDEGDALTSAMVKSDDDGASYAYMVGFLAAGTYTAAFTCSLDTVDADEDTTIVAFEPADGVTFDIVEDETWIENFDPPNP